MWDVRSGGVGAELSFKSNIFGADANNRLRKTEKDVNRWGKN